MQVTPYLVYDRGALQLQDWPLRVAVGGGWTADGTHIGSPALASAGDWAHVAPSAGTAVPSGLLAAALQREPFLQRAAMESAAL